MQDNTKIYGGVVVRLTDQLILCKAPGHPPDNFSIPGTVWAEVVSKCCAPNFRTSSFISFDSDAAAAVASKADGENTAQLSYHIMTDNELGFAVLADKAATRRHCHAALDEVSRTFRKMFVESVSKLNTKSVDVFVKTYRDILLRMSESGDANDKVRKVKKAVDEVKGLALDNVEQVIQRGQLIENIVQSTEELQFQAQGFQRSSRDLRQQLWWNSIKGKLIFGGAAAFFIILVLFVFFSGNGGK